MKFSSVKRSLLSAASGLFVLGAIAGSSAMAQGRATLNYEGADLAAVTRDVSLRTGRIFVTDPRLSGQVNIVSPPDLSLSPDEVWQVFLATLQVNGFSAVPIGDREYKIIPSQQAIREGGGGNSGALSSTVTQVIPLRYVTAASAASNLRGLVGETGIVTPIVESNALIVVDTPANVNRLVSLVKDVDIDDSIVRTIALQNASASELSNTLLEIINAQPGDGRRPSQVSVVAVDTSNSVIIRGPAAEVNRLAPIVQELDREGAGRIALDTVYLNHADAEEIVPIIQELIDTSFGGENGGTIGGIRPSIGFHKATNALVINAPPEVQRVIRSIVSRLDIRRPQVQIEAVVVEISNNTAREIGVQYVSGGENIPISAASFTGTSPNIVSAAGAAYFLGPGSQGRSRTVVVRDTDGNPVIRDDGSVATVREDAVFDSNDPSNAVAGQLVEAAVSELLNFNGFLLGGATRNSDGSVFGVILSAIQSDGQSNVLSVPSVTLLDNETAMLQVGQEIPVVTGQSTGSDLQNTFRTVERKDVGNILEVTPQINDGNTVQLKLRLEVSSIGAFTSLTDDIITNKSTIETVALAEDGQTLVVGGLIDKDRRDTASKVPIMGDIPILGNLFKGQTRSNEDSTLMIFIRPTILRDGAAADQVTARKYDYVRQQQEGYRRGSSSGLDDLMQNYLGPGNYVIPQPASPAHIPVPVDTLPTEEAGGAQ
ncbi:MAG: type II secretion system secretin GspD [Pseudomonadota bacterium]